MKLTRKSRHGHRARKEMRDFIFRNLHLLNYTARDMMALRWAVVDGEPLTWTTIAAITGNHLPTIQHNHDKALDLIVRRTAETDIPELAQAPYAEWAAIKEAARRKARSAVRRGNLAQQPCERCGVPDSEIHPPNYFHPLRVSWLCKSCHGKAHSRKRAA